ncbi:MAG: hypothetical protein V3U41_04595 [candidate division NC10 bacterium]|jgi:chromosome segregation ATPase
MRDAVTWVMLFVACAVVGVLGYRYYKATQQIALLTEKTSRLTAEIEGVTEVHKLTEAKSATKLRQTVTGRDKLKADMRGLKKELAKARKERDALKKQFGALKSDAKKMAATLKAVQGDKKKLTGEIQTMQAEKEQLDRRVARREKEFATLQRTLQGMEKARRADQEALRAWQGTARRLLEEQKRLQAELQIREEEFQQATLLEAERAAEVHKLTETLEEREKRIAALRKQLQETGVR